MGKKSFIKCLFKTKKTEHNLHVYVDSKNTSENALLNNTCTRIYIGDFLVKTSYLDTVVLIMSIVSALGASVCCRCMLAVGAVTCQFMDADAMNTDTETDSKSFISVFNVSLCDTNTCWQWVLAQ